MIIAHGTLVLVLDGGKMLLFRNEGTATSPDLQALEHLEADNPRSAMLGTDRPGRNHARFAGNRSAMAETDLHDEQETRFISDAIAKLTEVHRAEQTDIILIAANSALGEVRKHLSRDLGASVVGEIPKDLVHHTTSDIIKAVDAHER